MAVTTDLRYESMDVPIAELRSSELNPRDRFDVEALNELAEDIEAHGMLEPIIVRPRPNDPGVMDIIAGERRYRAAQQLGMTTVPVRLASREVTDAESLELAIAENIRRSNLDDIEVAKAYQRLTDISGRSQAEVGELVGKSPAVISNTLKLLRLPAPVQARIKAGEIAGWSGVQVARFAEFPAVAEMIAELAAKNHTPSADLERGLPFARELVRAGLAFDVPPDLSFNSQLQKDRAAYIRSAPGSNHGYYLNVERYQTLKGEADAAAKAREDENRNRALGKPTPTTKKGSVPARRLPMLDEMPGDAYIRLDTPGAIPAGCTEECPCRGSGLLSDGSTKVPICVDTRRYKRLAKATDRSEEKRLLARHQALDEWLTTYAPRIENYSGAEMAVIFGRTTQWLGVPMTKALAQLGMDLPEAGVQSDAFLSWLASLSPGDLLRLMFVSALRDELNGDGGMRREMAVTRWYLNAVGETIPEPVTSEDDAPESTESGVDGAEAQEGAAVADEATGGTGASEDWPPVDASETTGAGEPEPVAV